MSLSKAKFCGYVATGVLLTVPMKGLLAQTAVSEAAGVQNVNVLEALVLGIVQGLTEFLPISSTAHLKVVPVLLGWGDPGVTFTAVIQLGSIAAVLWYFWQDLKDVFGGAIQAIRSRDYQGRNFKIALGIILGSIPIILGGLLIKILVPDFDNSPVRKLGFIAFDSIVMSLLLGLAEKFGRRQRDYDQVQLNDGIWMGVGQALALLPGCSRSGSTLTAGLFLGLERAAAARFSFLLGIPAITLAGLVEMKDAIKEIPHTGPLPLIVGLVSAAVVSYISIAWLLKFLQTQNTWIFVWYRLAFGGIILALIYAKVIANV